MGAPGKSGSKRIVAAMLAAAAFFAVGLAFLVLVALQTQESLQAEADAYVTSLDAMSTQIDHVFTGLKSEPPAPCTPAFQKVARQLIFDNLMIRDVLTIGGEGRPICSATEGRLDIQPPIPAPKMLAWHNQRDIWHAFPLPLFGGERTSWAIREGDFVVIADMLDDTAIPSSGDWEVRASNPGESGHFHVRGVEGVQGRYTDIRNIPLLNLFAAYECSSIEYACFSRLASPASVWRSEHTSIIFGLVLALAMAALAYSTAGRWLDSLASTRRRIERALKTKTGFYCVYQPIVDMRDGSTNGCEVLARFEDQYGSLSPAVFVPIVQQLGHGWAFTEHMLTMAIADLEFTFDAWPEFRLSVNFYPEDICDSKLETIRQSAALQRAAELGVHLNCEVLETGFGLTESRAEVCRHFRSCGFTIAVDDFGTGASNLQQLQDLQPDYVKIDRSFISGSSLDASGVRTSLIPHIIAIAKSVEAEVIAEGVETFAQAQLMRNMGIRYAQGYFYSYPLSIDAFLRYLADEPQRQSTPLTSIG